MRRPRPHTTRTQRCTMQQHPPIPHPQPTLVFHSGTSYATRPMPFSSDASARSPAEQSTCNHWCVMCAAGVQRGTHACTHRGAERHTCMHTHARAHTHMHMQPCTCTHTDTHAHTWVSHGVLPGAGQVLRDGVQQRALLLLLQLPPLLGQRALRALGAWPGRVTKRKQQK